jgi:hypothetical protein
MDVPGHHNKRLLLVYRVLIVARSSLLFKINYTWHGKVLATTPLSTGLSSMDVPGLYNKEELSVVLVMDLLLRLFRISYTCFGKASTMIRASSGQCSMASPGQHNRRGHWEVLANDQL